MKRLKRITWMLAALAMLALAGPAWGGWNDGLATDPNCVAVWNFENGALTTDSKGTNTLTAVYSPVADTVNFQQGAASCDFEQTDKDYFKITDASLSTGFPGKSGGHVEDFTVCFWMKGESFYVGGANYTISKGVTGDTGGYIIRPMWNTGRISIDLWSATDGAHLYSTFSTLALSVGTWYHVQVRYDASENVSARGIVRVYDSGTDTSTKTVGSAGIIVNTSLFTIGTRSDPLENTSYQYDGLLDEVAVFNDLLTDDECDQVRAGTYGQGVGSLRRAWWWRRRHEG